MAMPAEAATTNEQQAGPLQPAKKAAAAKKRRNPSAAAADAPAQPNTLLFGGHIGTTSSRPPPPGWLGAGGGHRRTLPESILPFKLPTRSHGQPIAPAANDDQDSSSSSSSDSDDSDDSDPESSARRKRRRATSAAHRSGMLLNQSLRQSRLFYMASLLPPHSHRTKAGLQFPNSIPEEQLHGMVPAQKGTYNVVPLGKVHLEIGPHLYANTRIFEMTKASLAPPGAAGSPPVAGSGGRPTPQGSPKEKRAKKTGPKGGRKSGEPKAPKVSKKDAKAQQQQRQAEQPAPSGMPPHMRPPATASGSGSGSGPSSPLTSPPPADSSPRPPPPQGSTSSSSSNTPQPPTAKQIDPNLVNRVNAKAANDPGLRALLHVAAKGQASPEQLRELGLVIAKVTKEMEAEGFKVQTGMARSSPQGQQGSKPPPPLPKPGGSKEGDDGLGSGKGKEQSKGKGKDKAIKEEQQGGPETGPSSATATESAPATKPSKPKKAKAAAETSEGAAINTAASPSSASSGAADRTPAEASATTSSNSTKTTAKSARPAPSTSSSIRPLAVTPTPPPPKPNRPPILIVEFRESLSHRYYLPVHPALVTRTLRRQTPYASTGVREMISGLGDDAEEMDGGEEIEEDGSVRERGGMVDVVETEMKFVAPVRGSDAVQAGAGVGEKGTRGFPVTIRFMAVAPSQDEIRGGQGQQHQQQQQSLAALWEAVGRIPGVTTIGGEEEESKGLNHQEEVKVKEEGNDAAAKADRAEPPPIIQAASESRSMDVDRPVTGEAEKDDLARAEGDEQEEAQRRALELKARHEAEIQRQREVARKEANDLVRREQEHVATLERALSAALSHLPAPLSLDWSKPLPPGLEPHLTDSFAPQLGSSVQFGIAGQVDGRRKNTSINASASVPQLLGADEDLEVDGDTTIASASSFSQDVSHPPIPTGLTRSGKPKRRPRPVATHNADGSLKRCSACGTSTTPMWRRGPLGVGTLCNACGARWRAGRGGDWEASARAGAKGVGGGGGGGGGGSDVPPSQEVGGEKEGDDEQMEGQAGVVGAVGAEQA